MTSASGYITQFNKETNVGCIQIQDDETNKRYLQFHFYSLKSNSRRYVTKDNSTFVDELFDFNIVQHEDGTIDEAVNIRHCVLKCPIFGCSRIKAFTHKKALDEHIESKHCRVKKVDNMTSQKMPTWPSQNKQTKTIKPSRSFLSDLLAPSASVIGRFIGKNGVNLKQFEEANNGRLKILTKIAFNSLLPNSIVRVQVRLFDAKVHANVVITKLKLLWERAARKQQAHEDRSKQYFAQRRLPSSREIDFDSDTRHARAFILADDELIRQRSTRYEQTELLLRKQKARFRWALEMHRCVTIEDDRQQRRRKSVIVHHQKDKKKYEA
ncbi:unnamed protein product [Adineta steineri]|uniref:Uncharacterized protein n=1 Tax=Adineta steineri TaxID=433720 RepID=A0A815HGT0_9BILA|nr:unnamed protein product [Adineta steineri]CAF1417437.1 unnamed protein product [Adineta steineri]CAF3908096.1 unnamed protein product [Adineta steineri]